MAINDRELFLSLRVNLPFWPTLLTGAFLLSLAWFLLWRLYPQIAAENQSMECFQALCLGGGTLLYVIQVPSKPRPELKIITAGLSLLLLSILLRELDLAKAGAPEWLLLVGTGKGRLFLLGALWLALLTTALPRFGLVYRVGIAFLGTRSGVLVLLAGSLYLLSWPFDKHIFHFSRPTDMFLEELVEAHAGLLLLISAFFERRRDQSL